MPLVVVVLPLQRGKVKGMWPELCVCGGAHKLNSLRKSTSAVQCEMPLQLGKRKRVRLVLCVRGEGRGD